MDTQHSADRIDVGFGSFSDPLVGVIGTLNLFGLPPFSTGSPTWGTVTPGSEPNIFIGNPDTVTLPPAVRAGIVWQVTMTLQATPGVWVSTLGDQYPVSFSVDPGSATLFDCLLNSPLAGSDPETSFMPAALGAYPIPGAVPSGSTLTYPDTTVDTTYESVVLSVLVLPVNPDVSINLSVRVYSGLRTFYALANAFTLYDTFDDFMRITMQIRPVLL